MIGGFGRRSLGMAGVALVAVVACCLPASAAATSTETTEEGAVVKPITTSPWAALRFWTQARLEKAEPLSIITLPEPPVLQESPLTDVESPTPEPMSAAAGSSTPVTTAALTEAGAAPGAAVEGIEIGESEATAFPNSANGKVFGAFLIEGEFEGYECSGSVVDSPEGDLVLTAGHCAIDRETGAVAKYVIFIPGYHKAPGETEAVKPYGVWFATKIATTETWEKTAKPRSSANEGGDLAFLTLDQNAESVVGALGIAFNQSCNQTYTQYGYPGEEPYDGGALYSHVSSYAGPDTNLSFTPTPFKIHSDFTPGSSGGPWTVGPASSPTALSVTAYGYANQPGVLFGPYFGEAARKVYNVASHQKLPAGIEETCKALPETPSVPPTTQTPSSPPPPESTVPAPSPVAVKVTRVRHRANGSAVLIAHVTAAGMLTLRGAAVRAESVDTSAAGKYRLIVVPKGHTIGRLRQKGRARVGVKIAFRASGKTSRVSRAIRLSRRSPVRRLHNSARRHG